MTKREGILAAVITALAGTSGVSTRIYRSRIAAFNKAERPAIVVEPVTDSATREAVGRFVWAFGFSVMLVVEADVADSTADPIIQDAHNKIMTNTALQALVSDLVPVTTDYKFFEANPVLAVITMHFQATYQTRENDLTTT